MKDANTEEKFKAAAKKFESIHGFMDADEKCRQCLEKAEESRKDAIYHAAIKDMERDARLKYGEAISKLESIRGWRDADKKIQECSDRLAEIERKREDQRIADDKADKERRIAAQKAAEKKKRILSIAISAVIAVVAFVLVLIKVIIPNSKYNDAVALMDAGNSDEAYSIFQELGNYKDSAEKAGNIRVIKNKEKLKNANVGSYVTFGAYEQDNNNSNGKEDVEWLVLAKEGNKVLVISKYALDCQQYNTSDTNVTWETCSLRKWLNGTFINNAFSAEEQAMIPTVTVSDDKEPDYSTDPGNATQDKVFLLSIAEAYQYFTSDETRKCAPTDYAIAQGALGEYIGDSYKAGGRAAWWWWLLVHVNYNHTAGVNSSGDVRWGGVYGGGLNVDSDVVAVRPALWINLDP